jgi:hypothetical protein
MSQRFRDRVFDIKRGLKNDNLNMRDLPKLLPQKHLELTDVLVEEGYD